MVSKTFLFLALALAVVLLISSEVAAKDLASSHENEVKDAKYGYGGYNNGGGAYNGGYNNGGGGYNGGGSYNNGGYNNGGGGYNNGQLPRGYGSTNLPFPGSNGGNNGGGGSGGNYCMYGCCGGARWGNGCSCCSTFAEATASKTS